MYPTSSEKQRRQNLIKKVLLFGAPILFVVLVVATLLTTFWPTPSLQQYDLEKTGLEVRQDFAHLDKSELYAYNGLAFYKTNLESGDTTVLSSGLKLPLPSSVYWANSRGALMDFSSSYYLSEVQEALRAEGQQLNDDSRNYTWYLDFASGSLKLVNTDPVAAELVYYSEADNGFYYITDTSKKRYRTTALYFYDIDSGRNETVSYDLRLASVRALQACPAAGGICFIGRDKTEPTIEKLYTLNQDGKKQVVINSKGRVFATNDPARYVVVGLEEKTATTGNTPAIEEVEARYSEEPAFLHNIETSEVGDLGFNIGFEQPLVHFTDNDQFYIFGSVLEKEPENEQLTFYRSGTLNGNSTYSDSFPVAYSDGSAFTGQVISSSGHGQGSLMLLGTLEGSYVLFGSTQQNSATLTPKSPEAAAKAVESCVTSHAQDSQYFSESGMFRIFFTADGGFAEDIAAFSDCILTSNEVPLHGYNFQFAGLDPVNGRIVTD